MVGHIESNDGVSESVLGEYGRLVSRRSEVASDAKKLIGQFNSNALGTPVNTDTTDSQGWPSMER